MEEPVTVKVYGKIKGCVQCDATKRYLTKLDIPFDFIDVTEDEKAFAKVLAWGYQVVPVVEADDYHFGGYRPDLLAGLITHRKAA